MRARVAATLLFLVLMAAGPAWAAQRPAGERAHQTTTTSMEQEPMAGRAGGSSTLPLVFAAIVILAVLAPAGHHGGHCHDCW